MRLHRPSTQLALVATIQVLALSVWFASSAVMSALTERWSIGSVSGALLTVTVQVGFAVGAFVSALFLCADRYDPRRLMGIGALTASACTALLAASPSVGPAYALRFVTGAALALVYPVGMKVVTSWFGSAHRGVAIGTMIGALAMGSLASPFLAGFVGDQWRLALLGSSVLAVMGAVLAASFVRLGPHVSSPNKTPIREAWDELRQGAPLLVNVGYLGHMWELYAVWAWVPVWLKSTRYPSDDGVSQPEVAVFVLVAFGVFGLVGSIAAGWGSDRWGRIPITQAAVAVSALCCLLIPWSGTAPTIVLGAGLAIWGASVIADSGLYSTLLTEVADRRFCGTALTLQTCLGFLLTTVTISLVPVIADHIGWRVAFASLAVGPITSFFALQRLRSVYPEGAVL